ncbi:DUF1156 domain-containing protein [Luedemannella flava]
MHRVIDDQVADGVKEMLADHALAHDALAEADIAELRRQMDDARARRLQPHYIEWAFRNGFSRLGGRMAKRERGRFEISNVPAGIRASTRRGPIPTRYERVTFDVAAIEPPDDVRADLLAPGHPLHDAVAEQTILQCGQALARGTVLVSPTVDRPVLLVGVIEEIIDATEAPIARRFGYAYVEADGTVTPAGPAPYLDCVSAPTTPAIDNARALPWLADAEARATSWVVSTQLPAYLAEIGPRRLADLGRTRDHVTTRLNHEINRLAGEALQADEQTQRGTKPRESAESLTRKAADLETRLERRLHELDRQAHLSPRPPRVLTAALVLPLSSVEDELPEDAPIHARETKEVERRGVDLVMSTERTLGRRPTEQPFNNPGFDILSETSDRPPIRIEVKARIDGADDFFVTHNEIVLGRNAARTIDWPWSASTPVVPNTTRSVTSTTRSRTSRSAAFPQRASGQSGAGTGRPDDHRSDKHARHLRQCATLSLTSDHDRPRGRRHRRSTMDTPAHRPKLIEVALPLEAINRESAREKSIRHGHPSTLHLWWSRKPLSTARAVLFAQLVDDPSGRPDRFPTADAQQAERDRLHDIIKRLVVWENISDERLLAEARAEIVNSCDGNPPPILDPFAGGGSIPSKPNGSA